MMHVAEEGNRRKGGMTDAEITQSVLGENDCRVCSVPSYIIPKVTTIS